MVFRRNTERHFIISSLFSFLLVFFSMIDFCGVDTGVLRRRCVCFCDNPKHFAFAKWAKMKAPLNLEASTAQILSRSTHWCS